MKAIATVLLQDYFHRSVFNDVVSQRYWERFESTLERNVDSVLELLGRHDAHATFFVLGWIAERNPALILRILEEGHEIADSGYWVRRVSSVPEAELITELRRSKRILETITEKRVWGFRAPYLWLSETDAHVFRALLKTGYAYDASFRPKGFSLSSENATRYVRSLSLPEGTLYEVPPSSVRVGGFNSLICGGNYFRQLPHRVMRSHFKKWIQSDEHPYVLYFHPWELDAEQPKITAIGPMGQLRQYRNLGKLKDTLPDYLREAQFTSIRDYLGLEDAEADTDVEGLSWFKQILEHEPLEPLAAVSLESDHPTKEGTPVTVVIPCYNEVDTLPYLERALEELSRAAMGHYKFTYLFVDDCSSDTTREELQKRFGEREDCTLVFHEVNRGVAGAVMTGLNSATTKVVCSIDADCSYDPLALLDMIPSLEEGVDMVTASPYHKDGAVLGVPGWRLFLSKSLSTIYHARLHHKFSTYTSCFRVYRRDRVVGVNLRYGDFRGIVELLARIDMAGGKLREFPATLQSRIFGVSKMKTVKTILGHLGLLATLRNTPETYQETPYRHTPSGGGQ